MSGLMGGSLLSDDPIRCLEWMRASGMRIPSLGDMRLAGALADCETIEWLLGWTEGYRWIVCSESLHCGERCGRACGCECSSSSEEASDGEAADDFGEGERLGKDDEDEDEEDEGEDEDSGAGDEERIRPVRRHHCDDSDGGTAWIERGLLITAASIMGQGAATEGRDEVLRWPICAVPELVRHKCASARLLAGAARCDRGADTLAMLRALGCSWEESSGIDAVLGDPSPTLVRRMIEHGCPWPSEVSHALAWNGGVDALAELASMWRTGAYARQLDGMMNNTNVSHLVLTSSISSLMRSLTEGSVLSAPKSPRDLAPSFARPDHTLVGDRSPHSAAASPSDVARATENLMAPEAGAVASVARVAAVEGTGETATMSTGEPPRCNFLRCVERRLPLLRGEVPEAAGEEVVRPPSGRRAHPRSHAPVPHDRALVARVGPIHRSMGVPQGGPSLQPLDDAMDPRQPGPSAGEVRRGDAQPDRGRALQAGSPMESREPSGHLSDDLPLGRGAPWRRHGDAAPAVGRRDRGRRFHSSQGGAGRLRVGGERGVRPRRPDLLLPVRLPQSPADDPVGERGDGVRVGRHGGACRAVAFQQGGAHAANPALPFLTPRSPTPPIPPFPSHPDPSSDERRPSANETLCWLLEHGCPFDMSTLTECAVAWGDDWLLAWLGEWDRSRAGWEPDLGEQCDGSSERRTARKRMRSVDSPSKGDGRSEDAKRRRADEGHEDGNV